VSPFTAAPASAGERTRAATMNTAPRSAADGRRSAANGRSSDSHGTRPAATATYVTANLASATGTPPSSMPLAGRRATGFDLYKGAATH